MKQSSVGFFARRGKARDDIASRGIRKLRAWSRKPFVLVAGVLVVGVVIVALFMGGYVGRSFRSVDRTLDAVSASMGFGIAEVHISGNTRTPPEALVAALGLEPGQSIFAADLQAARHRLMALDWVAQADVRRRYPGSIYVTIVEKLPFALWQSPSGLFVIERSGGTITAKNPEVFASLPKLVGEGANNGADMVDAVAAHRAIAARIRAIERVSNRRWNLILDEGVIVKLPETGWQAQVDALERLIVDKGVLERDIAEIDLRSSTNYFFVLKSGQKKNFDGGKPI